MADWSTLPMELLHLISQKLPTALDHLRFRSVCVTWRIAVPPLTSATRFPILPNSGISDTSWGFHLSKRTVYSILSPSAHLSPWIIKIERDHPSRMHLLNPLSRAAFKPLPDTFPKLFNFSNLRVKELGEEYALQYINFRPMANSIGEAGNLYMEKVAVMNHSVDEFVLLTIHVSGKLVVYKSGEEKWRVIDYLPSPYDDVIMRKGAFYAVDNTGRMVSVDCVNLNVSVVADSIYGGDKKFLVESIDDELLLVDMYLSSGTADDLGYAEGFEFYEDFDCFMSERTVEFKVFRLDEGARWVEMNDLGDGLLFLGDNCSFSASAAELFPNGTCGKNCIFFTDQYCGREDDGVWKSRGIGMFVLGSGQIGSIGSHEEYSKMFWPPPEWVFPVASIEAGLNRLNV